MKLLAAQGTIVGVLGRALELRPQGSNLFAAALLAFLILLVGAPVSMVILMSFRTGFPGEDVPFTLDNYLDIYTDPAFYEILVNTFLLKPTILSPALRPTSSSRAGKSSLRLTRRPGKWEVSKENTARWWALRGEEGERKGRKINREEKTG